MNKLVRFLPTITIITLALLLMNTISKDKEPVIKNVAESYEIKAIKVPERMELAGEQVPLDRNDIKERMDRELLVNTYWQSNGLLLIKRAHKFFPIIEPLLKKYDLPDDFKYLCVAESALINIPSSKGAAGYWHFLPSTGREFGLEVNRNVDERYNLEKSTRVAAAYLKKAKRKFGSWTLAAAAYNAGNGRISQRLKQQQVTDYYDLLLNTETGRYIFRILALKEVLSNPKKYGFVFDQEDLYTFPSTYEVKVDTAITNIASFAKNYGITYKDLKIVNPWLRETKLNNKSRKEYIIKIPTSK
ncbi:MULTISPECIES: lytic transglycosylase domain-containing protein [Tenacibaculum]|uniref:lytic transglycosylase domain-containing protein n=1 Tax=Tenacibaculum TaxID=104267 RepID=UPI0008949646|nr:MULTISPECIES: lytic transglycosylase domain-containing protein [unclassified Tenacibaculum]RBW61914.1 lytic transglycosylase domain-containing protein [Tenacibaculum sp. E3R01]SEE64635.1 Soluble lytic murein transglycosylase [Tenacibaculum sp. MAR_2010_89]